MSEELQQKLRDQLWAVANRLRGNMSASDFMYFTLGFIFYKYLSEKIETYANSALEDDEVTFKELWEMTDSDAAELQEEVKNQCLENIGYFIEPKFLFSSVIETIKRKENILPMLERSLKRFEDSTLGRDSEEDFGGLFSEIDLASPKLGKTTDDKNTLISNVLLALDDIKFGVEASQELVVFEAAIDLMSYVDIFTDYESNKLALGMLADAPLETFLREHPQITSIRFCLDGDEPGRKAAAELMRKYYELGYEVEDCPPPAGYKDYNEWLVAAKHNLNQMNQRVDDPVRA